MKITYLSDVKDPVYPIMHGSGPMAKEFNKRQKEIFKEGKFHQFNYEQVTTVLLEILCDEYDKRHASRKRKKGVEDRQDESVEQK